ncbi:MAG: S1 RNA-binding domain-containing protein, partial [Gammaproteobacteria bacterium]|nr:S1 RNA-binding domain-containing protein [Gammaproteobacteria bacterium]
DEDPFNGYLADNKKGAIVKGNVTAVDAKGATVMLEGGVEGYVRVSDIARERIEDATTVLKVGEEVEARLMGVDRKNRVISLSIKAKFEAEEKEAMDTIKKQDDTDFGGNAMAEAFKAAQKAD